MKTVIDSSHTNSEWKRWDLNPWSKTLLKRKSITLVYPEFLCPFILTFFHPPWGKANDPRDGLSHRLVYSDFSGHVNIKQDGSRNLVIRWLNQESRVLARVSTNCAGCCLPTTWLLSSSFFSRKHSRSFH